MFSTSLKFSELNSGTDSLDSYTSPDETHPGSDIADNYTLTHSKTLLKNRMCALRFEWSMLVLLNSKSRNEYTYIT